MNWRQYAKRIIPSFLLNEILLQFPFLYQTNLVYYETNFLQSEINELLHQLKCVLDHSGDVVECGSSRCGASIIMANFLRRNGVQKTIYALDSFVGMNSIELEQERKAGLTTASDTAFSSTSYAYVQKKIEKLGVEKVVIPVRGFFQDTLPHIESTMCFALIDCVLQDSVVYCAETIWPHLISGGRLVFDDYTSQEFQGAKLGIDFFVNKYMDQFSEHGLANNLYSVCKK